jgi:hypothetical protein
VSARSRILDSSPPCMVLVGKAWRERGYFLVCRWRPRYSNGYSIGLVSFCATAQVELETHDTKAKGISLDIVQTFLIFLTALVTVIGGAMTFAVGQIIVRGAIEPALELKRLIGTIASDLEFYANKFHPGDQFENEWRDLFRKHSCSLREKLNVIVWYSLFEHVIRLPPEASVRAAAYELMGHSNRSNPPVMSPELGGRESQIKKLLRIST